MRINNPRLFNGQFLASQNQIADWLGLGLLDAVNGGSGISGQISASLIPISGISIVDGKFPIFGTTVKIDETANAQTIKAYIDSKVSDLNIGNYATTKYVDAQDDLYLASAKVYTDDEIAKLKTYVEEQDDLHLLSANFYTDGKISGIQAQVDAVKQYNVEEGKAIDVTKTSTELNGITTDTFTVAVDYAGIHDDVSGQIASELQMVKVSGETADFASSYALQLNGITLGSEINIPKDQFLDAASYVPSAEVLRLTFKLPKGESNVVDIPVGELVDEYSAGNGIAISDDIPGKNVISAVAGKAIKVDANGISVVAGNGITVDKDSVEVLKSTKDGSEAFFFVDDTGVGVSGIQTAIDDAISAAFDGHRDEWTYTGVAPIKVDGTEISLNVGDGLVSGETLKVKVSDAEYADDFFFVDSTGAGVSGVQAAIDAAKDYAAALDFAQIVKLDTELGTTVTVAPEKDTLYVDKNGQTGIVLSGTTAVIDISQEYINSGAEITANSAELTTGKAVYEFVSDSISGKMDLVPGAVAGNIATFDGVNGQVVDSAYAVFTGDLSGVVTDKQIPVATTVKDYVDAEVQKAVAGDVADFLLAKADKVTGAVSGNLAGLDEHGNLTDSGKKVVSEIVEASAADTNIPSETAVVDFVNAKTSETVEVVNKKAVEMIEEEVFFGKTTGGSVPGRVIAVYDETGEQVYPTIKYAAGASKLSTDVANATYTVIYAKRIGLADGSLPAYTTANA